MGYIRARNGPGNVTSVNSKDRSRGQERGIRDSKQEQGDKPPVKWVSSEKLIRRGERNVCFRCGRDGHRIRNCSFEPQRPVKIKKADSTGEERLNNHNDKR